MTVLIADRHRIPRLGRDVDEKLAACHEELKSLPPQITGEPASYVLALLSSFCVDVQSHIMGAPGTEALVQHNRRVYEEFKRAIRSTAPRFIPQPSAIDVPPNFSSQETADPDDDEGLEDELPSGSSSDVIYLKDMRLHIQRYVCQLGISVSTQLTAMTLLPSRSVTRELPFNVPYPAKTALIRSFQTSWEQHSHACFDRIERQFRVTLTQIMRAQLGRFKKLEVKVECVIVTFQT